MFVVSKAARRMNGIHTERLSKRHWAGFTQRESPSLREPVAIDRVAPVSITTFSKGVDHRRLTARGGRRRDGNQRAGRAPEAGRRPTDGAEQLRILRNVPWPAAALARHEAELVRKNAFGAVTDEVGRGHCSACPSLRGARRGMQPRRRPPNAYALEVGRDRFDPFRQTKPSTRTGGMASRAHSIIRIYRSSIIRIYRSSMNMSRPTALR